LINTSSARSVTRAVVVRGCLKGEPSTQQFEVLIAREDDSKLLIYEIYQDDAAFDVHRTAHRLQNSAKRQP
jgi:quinol monooxygenase YgiN